MLKYWRRANRWRKMLLLGLLAVVVLALSGCRTVSYYAQAIKGQYQILAAQELTSKLLVKSNTPPRLRQQLELVQALRKFAETNLALPVDGHYQKYADLHRPFVVWNLQATPEFSMEPKAWWYPMVGRLEYRGYFAEKAATNYAAYLRNRGYDVHIGGVGAYSTLGWFKDPLLNTFVFDPEPDLAETIFHELGHQRVFARGDTDFNEAFATTVGQEGALRWLKANGKTNVFEAYLADIQRNEQFVRIVRDARLALEKLYGDQRTPDGKVHATRHPPGFNPELVRSQKQRIFDELRARFAQLQQQWGGSDFRHYWFSRPINNAKLVAVANYHDLVPGFEALLAQNGGDLERFYAAAEQLARKKSKQQRHEWLLGLAAAHPQDQQYAPGPGPFIDPAGSQVHSSDFGRRTPGKNLGVTP